MGIKTFLSFLVIFLITLFSLGSSFGEDLCREEGIVVKNMTMLDLWYRKNSGECHIWIHNHILVIKPEDEVNIFSDLICKTPYCKDNPTYKDYKSTDTDGNCRVRILPDCNLSDM